jgi:hypothetical protein
VEVLEDRRLLAASLSISGGTLLFQAAGSAMNLTTSVDGADVYTFRDPTQAITLGGGAGAWTLSGDGHTATGPASGQEIRPVVPGSSLFREVVPQAVDGLGLNRPSQEGAPEALLFVRLLVVEPVAAVHSARFALSSVISSGVRMAPTRSTSIAVS